jgi:carbon-monoxide dehydrogenase small subunit
MVEIHLSVNGVPHRDEVEPRRLLVHYLRETLGLTGTHVGCDTSQCGACTVLVDGKSVKSCTVLAVQADGAEVTTIEGIARGTAMHPVQEAFHQEHGLQCGFCTPGMMLTARALLDRHARANTQDELTDEEIREAISGQICRCTGYTTIVRSIRWAAERERVRTTEEV